MNQITHNVHGEGDAMYEGQFDSQQHGVSHGFYSNLPGPNQTAWLECLCGEEVTGQTSSWEDAGREMDLHLKGVTEAQQ